MRELKDRQWWPDDYVDEVVPTSRATPQAWIIPMPAGGGFTLASAYHDDPKEQADRLSDGDISFEPLKDGQQLKFVAFDDFGDLHISVAADGSYVILSGTLDPRADHFWEWFNNEGPLGDSLEEFAKEYAESDGAADEIHVGMGSWSHTETFEVQIKDGSATLVSAGAA
jgi:hypothetical protein